MAAETNCVCSEDCKQDKCQCCPWCCDKCKTEDGCKGSCNNLVKTYGYCIRQRCPKCKNTKLDNCDCKCCKERKPVRPGISIFFAILLVFIVIGLIIYFATWHQIPKLRSIRDYWNGKISSTSS